MHPYDVLTLENGAKLIFTPCPGTKTASLEDSVYTLEAEGANAVVTLMPANELEKFGASELPEVCRARGIRWFHLPVEDDSAPEQPFDEAFGELKPTLLEMIREQQTIAIHCRGGSGRTGLMAAILMLESGIGWGEVKAQIQEIRPKALVLPAHTDYLARNYL